MSLYPILAQLSGQANFSTISDGYGRYEYFHLKQTFQFKKLGLRGMRIILP